MLEQGDIGGIFISMQWYKFSQDMNGAAFGKLLSDIAGIAAKATPGTTINITLGIQAGVNTDCATLAANYAPIWNQVANNGAGRCEALPVVYQPPPTQNQPANAFVSAYVNAVTAAVGQFTSFQKSNPALWLTGIKLAGISSEDAETQIVGDTNANGQNAALAVANTGWCSNIQFPRKCGPAKEGQLVWLNDYSYWPMGVSAAWDQIVTGLMPLLGAPFNPILEVDALEPSSNDTSGPFPPIVAPDNSITDFNCNPVNYPNGKCQIYQDGNISNTKLVGINFLETELLKDLVQRIATGNVSVQTQALDYQHPQPYQGGPTPIPCWAFTQNWLTVEPEGPINIGFQTFENNSFYSDLDYAHYMAGLNNGVSFGAVYEEIFPQNVYSYLTYVFQSAPPGPNLTQRMADFYAVHEALINNAPGSRQAFNCCVQGLPNCSGN